MAATATGSHPVPDRFPILPANPLLEDPQESVPWLVLEGHDSEACRQHGLGLGALAVQGGLTWCELHAVVARTPYRPMPEADARWQTRRLLGLEA